MVRLGTNDDERALAMIRAEARWLARDLPGGYNEDDLESVGDEAYVLHLARGGWSCPEHFWGGLCLGIRFRMKIFLYSLRVKGRTHRRYPRNAFGEDIPLADPRAADPSDIAAARELMRTLPALCGNDAI